MHLTNSRTVQCSFYTVRASIVPALTMSARLCCALTSGSLEGVGSSVRPVPFAPTLDSYDLHAAFTPSARAVRREAELGERFDPLQNRPRAKSFSRAGPASGAIETTHNFMLASTTTEMRRYAPFRTVSKRDGAVSMPSRART